MLLFDICTLPWWLPWLLLPLLGLLAGWLLWGKYKGMIGDLEANIGKLKGNISGLESDLADCRAKRATLDSDLTLYKGRLGEAETKINAFADIDTGEVDTLKAKVSDLEAELLTVRGQLTDAEASISATADVEVDSSDWEAKIAGLEADLSACNSSKEALKADLEGQLSNLQAKYSKLKADREEVSSTDIAGMKGRITVLMNQVKDLEGQLAEKESAGGAGAAIAAGGAALAAGSFAGGDSSAEIDELKAKIADLEAQLATAKGDLSACEGSKAAMSAQISDLQGKLVAKPAAPVVKQGIASAVGGEAIAPKPAKQNIYAVLKSDNLQVVEGIGPKMDSILKKHDVHTWKELSEHTHESLRAILDKENPTRYRIIDPATWPGQAKLAHEGNWEELIRIQKQLDTGRTNVGDKETDSKVEKLLIKLGAIKKWKQDDLKAVEGIGPKIEGLLKAEGIDTWRKLSQTEVSKIQSILDAAGPRYKLADPGTWPKQAEMAADGRWDDLDEYQDFLQGGK